MVWTFEGAFQLALKLEQSMINSSSVKAGFEAKGLTSFGASSNIL